MDEYIKTLISTKGVDPFTRQSMNIGKLVRVRGGQRRKNYSNLRNLINAVPIQYVVENVEKYDGWLNELQELMNRSRRLTNNSREDIILPSDIVESLVNLTNEIQNYLEMTIRALKMEFNFVDQRRFVIRSNNLLTALFHIIERSMINEAKIVTIEQLINILQDILPNISLPSDNNNNSIQQQS